jgi:hypothetical protein
MVLLRAARRRESVPLSGVSFSAWLCLVALITVLPFVLPGTGRLMVNVIPVSLGLLLGLLVISTGARFFPYLTAHRKRARVRALTSRLRAALRYALQTARINVELRMTARKSHAIAARQRQAGEWLARLKHHTESARRPLTGALWLGIAGGLMGAFVVAT